MFHHLLVLFRIPFLFQRHPRRRRQRRRSTTTMMMMMMNERGASDVVLVTWFYISTNTRYDSCVYGYSACCFGTSQGEGTNDGFESICCVALGFCDHFQYQRIRHRQSQHLKYHHLTQALSLASVSSLRKFGEIETMPPLMQNLL